MERLVKLCRTDHASAPEPSSSQPNKQAQSLLWFLLGEDLATMAICEVRGCKFYSRRETFHENIWLKMPRFNVFSNFCWLFSFILLTLEGSQREVYQEFQHSYDIFRRSGAKGCSEQRFCAPPAYTAQLLTLHQHGANNQWIGHG